MSISKYSFSYDKDKCYYFNKFNYRSNRWYYFTQFTVRCYKGIRWATEVDQSPAEHFSAVYGIDLHLVPLEIERFSNLQRQFISRNYQWMEYWHDDHTWSLYWLAITIYFYLILTWGKLSAGSLCPHKDS